jgi:hypothetical protein
MSRREALIGTASLLAVPRLTVASAAGGPATGTFERPFGAQSLWNARPIDPLLGNEGIPAVNNNAYLEQSQYSSKLYRARASDGPAEVQGRDNPSGVWVADELQLRNVLIPHFPEETVPAAGSDGHCEIFDETTGLVHSFYRLIFDVGSKVWRASKYTVGAITSTGWGSPECPDGPRASATPSTSGLLRAHELGSEFVPHALAVAAHANVFRSGPVFPATLEDRNGPARYSGAFPMGTLFMLPTDFEADRLNWPNSRAIARTLKLYGARLIDQTQRTFSFGGEMNGGWSQAVGPGNIWRNSWAQDLTKIRDGLRPVVSVSRWLDANGKEFVPQPWERMNLLSMRGPWRSQGEMSGSVGGRYDTTSKLFLFPELRVPVSYRKMVPLRDDTKAEPWFQWTNGGWYRNPIPNHQYRLRAEGIGNASATFEIRPADGKRNLVSISDMRPGEESQIIWPAEGYWTSLVIQGFPGPPAGIRLLLELV